MLNQKVSELSEEVEEAEKKNGDGEELARQRGVEVADLRAELQLRDANAGAADQLQVTRVYAPQIRARLGTTAHFCKVVESQAARRQRWRRQPAPGFICKPL